VKIQDILSINKIARIFTSEVHNRWCKWIQKISVAVVFWYENRVASVEFKCFAYVIFVGERLSVLTGGNIGRF
jgi:hypothetical protein